MKTVFPVLLVMLLAVAPVAAEEAKAKAAPAVEPVSANALWFRLVVGVEKPRTILGFVDESQGTGKGYNRFVVDWNGDGTPEAVFAFPMEPHWESRKLVPSPNLRLTFGDVIFRLELYGLPFAEPEADGRRRPWMNWTLAKGEFWLHFINGRGDLYPSAEAAGRGKPIRLVPPFELDVKSTMRGPEALLSVGLVDANGCTLRFARDKRDRKISIRLLREKAVKLEATAEYG